MVISSLNLGASYFRHIEKKPALLLIHIDSDFSSFEKSTITFVHNSLLIVFKFSYLLSKVNISKSSPSSAWGHRNIHACCRNIFLKTCTDSQSYVIKKKCGPDFLDNFMINVSVSEIEFVRIPIVCITNTFT